MGGISNYSGTFVGENIQHLEPRTRCRRSLCAVKVVNFKFVNSLGDDKSVPCSYSMAYYTDFDRQTFVIIRSQRFKDDSESQVMKNF